MTTFLQGNYVNAINALFWGWSKNAKNAGKNPSKPLISRGFLGIGVTGFEPVSQPPSIAILLRLSIFLTIS